ncbi:hypothetical protein HY857_00270 [Candidatus Saccharibacteria bacterium]|nr:hypothetical protein [Candidatus Saccharibacteria bacterium]
MSSVNEEDAPKQNFRQPEYGFDVISGRFLLGQEAIDAHVEIGGHPADIHELSELLLTDELDNLPANHYNERRSKRLSKEECIVYGKWLLNIIALEDKVLNGMVLSRAHKIGLGPNKDYLVQPRLFDSLANFYIAIDAHGTMQNKLFDTWGIDDFVNYVSRIGRELGRKPTQVDINARSKESPQNPSSHIIGYRGLQLRKILELAGWPDTYSMSVDDHISHGVRFMFANNGLPPAQKSWDFLSKHKKGPSAAIIRYKFIDGFSEFKGKVIEAYVAEKARLEHDRKEKLSAIQAILDGSVRSTIPVEIFKGVTNDDELILRYAKYLVLDDLFPESLNGTKIGICTGRTQKAIERGFVGAIREKDGTITEADIEVSAVSLGVLDDISPPDTSYMETLRLPEEFLSPRRIRLTVLDS